MAFIFFLTLCSCFAASSAANDQAAILVVDPSWDDVGSYAVNVPLLNEFKIVKVFTHTGKSHHFSPGHAEIYRKFTFSSAFPDPPAAAAELCPQLKALDVSIAAVMPTSDGAVHLTDLLADCVGARGNPAYGPLAEARRNKWIMGEAIKNAGLRSVQEKIVSSWEEAQSFISKMSPPLSPQHPLVFKILQGSGGEGTNEIRSLEEAKVYFDSVQGTVSKFKEVNAQILIQEYMVGKEYAIDSVSRDGVHKVVDVWMEDFRPANGIFDQYFGFVLQDPADPKIKAIIDYTNKVLDAIGVQNGATNSEVKWLEGEDAPCAVEVNARWAGMNWHDGLAVENACMGNNQITATFTSYLDKEGFEKMPMVPTMKLWGASIATINYHKGVVKAIPGLVAAMKYPSYYDSDMDCPAIPYPEVLGKFLDKTIPDCIPVRIAFVHKDKAVVDADYNRVIKMEYADRFFDIVPESLSQSLIAFDNKQVNSMALLVLGACAAALFAIVVLKRKGHDGTEYQLVE